MANRLFINGQDITSDVVNLKEFEIEIGLNPSSKTIVKTLSQSVEVTGATFEMLKEYFFTRCNGADKTLKAIFKTDICGGMVIPLEITSEGLILSDDSITLLLKSVDEDDKAYDKLDSTYWFEDGFVGAYKLPLVYYADQPNLFSWVIIILITPLRVFFSVTETLWKAVCNVGSLGGLLFDCDFDLTSKIFGTVDTWLTGLGRWATAPLVREILTYQCQNAGLIFSSSILQESSSAYYNLGLFQMETGVRGSFKDTSDEKRISVTLDNARLWTVTDLLNALKITFEAEYRIINGVLYFEQESYFDDLVSQKLFHVKDKCTENKVEYTYSNETQAAYGEFAFQMDAYDTEGNKMIGYYKQKLEFNNPYNPAQKGKLTRFSEFGAPRFMFDILSYRKTGFFDWESLIDEFRDGPETFIESFLANDGVIRKYDLILAGNMLSAPKLLVFENNFNRNDALVIKKPYQKRNGKQYWMYNFHLMYKESLDKYENTELIEGVRGSLTNEYAITADPRLKKDRMYIDQIEIDCDCDVVTKLLKSFQTCYIQTMYGRGIPESATIGFNENKITVTISGIRIVCAD